MIFKRACAGFMLAFSFIWLSQSAFSKAPTAESFGALPSIYDAAISPNGKQLSAIINVDGSYFVRVLEIADPGAKASLVKLGKGVKPRWVKWANDTQVLVAFWQSEEMRGTQLTTSFIYTLNTESYKGRILVKPPMGMLRQYNSTVVDWLEDDPQHILMSYSDIDQLKSPDLWKVNVKTGHDTLVRRGIRDTQFWTTDHRGEPRVASGQKDNTEGTRVMKIRDANDENWRDVSEYPGLTADTRVFGFSSDLNEMIIGSYQGKETLGLYPYNLITKTLGATLYHNDEYDVSNIILSANGEDIVGAQYIADTEETVLLGGREDFLTHLRNDYPGYQIDYIDQSQDGDILVVKASGPYDPGYLLMSVKGGEPVNIGTYYNDLPPDELGVVIPVAYTARDGQKIPAYVTIPPSITTTEGLKNVPFIVMPHGGPYARDDKRFDYFAQFFATRGYGVLQMNFRGSEGYGKSFSDAGRKNWVVMQEDVEDGARFLLDKGYADPKRMCIVGWSYGGYAALMGAAKNSDLYSCAVSMAGLTDIPLFISQTRKYQFGRSSAQSFILDGFESRDDIEANSPRKLAEDITIPLFLAHGEDDQRVYFNQYQVMKTALRKSSADVTYLSFKDGDHFLSDQDNRIEFFKGLDKFLLKANGKSEFAR